MYQTFKSYHVDFLFLWKFFGFMERDFRIEILSTLRSTLINLPLYTTNHRSSYVDFKCARLLHFSSVSAYLLWVAA